MLHPIQPSCESALSWAMELQKDFIVGLCDSAMTPRKVTIRWATNLRPPVKGWIKRFVNRQYRRKKIVEHMKVIAKLSVSEKQELINHFNGILSFTNAFVDGAIQPAIKEIKDCPASSAVLALLEAFSELALRDLHLPVDANGNYGGSFSRDDYVRLHGDLNSPRICPFCDGELDRPQVEHWLGKAKYPALSCHPRNLLPTCYACNSVEKGTTSVINLGTLEPFSEWFHPYERQASGRLKITIKPPKVKVEAKDITDDKRVENLDVLLNLSDRWSIEYQRQKQDYLRELRVRFKREALSEPRFLEEVSILEELARESVYKAPHALLQAALMENVISSPKEQAAWLDETKVAINEP